MCVSLSEVAPGAVWTDHDRPLAHRCPLVSDEDIGAHSGLYPWQLTTTIEFTIHYEFVYFFVKFEILLIFSNLFFLCILKHPGHLRGSQIHHFTRMNFKVRCT